MRTGHADRLWLAGGAVAAAVLLVLGWLLLIGPQQARTGALDDRAATTAVQVGVLRHRLAELRQLQGNLPAYRQELERYQAALPGGAGTADLLRELQAAGTATGTSVTSVTIGAPIQVSTGASPIFALPVSLTASGTAPKLALLLDQLQRIQPRAVLVNNTDLVPVGQNGTLAGPVTMTVVLQAYLAPALAAPVPSVSASPSPSPSPSASASR